MPCHKIFHGHRYRFQLETEAQCFCLSMNSALTSLAQNVEGRSVCIKGYLDLEHKIFEVEKIGLIEKDRFFEDSIEWGDMDAA